MRDARIADPPEFPVRWTWQALALGIAFALVPLALARARTRAAARMLLATAGLALCVALGVAGLVLGALWALTDHVSAWRNENLLLLDPLCLLLLPAWFGALRLRWQPSRFAARLALVIALSAAAGFFVKILPAFPQDNAFWIALLLPLHIAFWMTLMQRRRR